MTGPFADVTDLRLLAAVAEHRSVSAAAQSVRISQPAASRRLHAIQTRVGMRLFQFGPRGALLTDAGRFWANEAIKVLRSLDDAQSRFATTFHLRNGLYFGAGHVVAEYLVPRWLAGWRHGRVAPASVVVGNSDEVIDMVVAAKVDFGVLEAARPVPTELVSEQLFPDRLVLVVPQDHGWADRGSLSAEEVAATPLIHRESNSGSQLKWKEAFAATGIDVAAPMLEVDSLAATKRAVTGGIGPAIVPRIAVEDELQAGRLHEIRIVGMDLEVWVTAVWLPSAELSPLARSFIEHLRSLRTSPLPA
jgi:DNA-binding transcriptional LysR family regulator